MTAPNVPQHVAIVMDGNGRWARRRGLPRIAGHRKGQERVREVVRAAGEAGVRYLTALDQEVAELHEHDVRFQVVGEVARFGEQIEARIRAAEALTRANTALTLTIAANYGGRWDITRACAAIAGKVQDGTLDLAAITPETVAAHLATHALPEPDLFIRTGGEQRISNFLLWQLAYTELYFTEAPWPDFDRAAFAAALASYAARQRRFGLTGEQIEAVRSG